MPCGRIGRSRIAVDDGDTGGCCSCKVYGRTKNRRIAKQSDTVLGHGQPRAAASSWGALVEPSCPALVILRN